ncbi:MAG: Flavin-dependent thymidylate synthase [Syntrophus sp. SKADARSKE-3]|nr:Flavin-dependent thymidylate synthase [Syntrophus sp. SKADARSKE-3]
MGNMKVTLLVGPPEEIAVSGALGCTDERSSADFLRKLQFMDAEKVIEKRKQVLADSFGRGHGSVGDQANFQFSLEGVSRLVTLFLCQSTHASFLQQSLRRVKAGGYVFPDALKDKPYAKGVVDKAFDLYEKMFAAGVPGEDARYILPLCTTTNIQVNVNARELCHLQVMANSVNVPNEVKGSIAQMVITAIHETGCSRVFRDYGANYEPLSFYPAPDLFDEDGPLDREHNWDTKSELIPYGNMGTTSIRLSDNPVKGPSGLKHIHFSFIAGMSLAALHQAMRQRTWDHTVETIANAMIWANRNWMDRIVVPPTVSEHDWSKSFALQHVAMLDAYEHAIEEGVPKFEAFGLLPHSLKIYDLFHINGWNAIHSIGKRTCSKAQWEIRRIAEGAAKQINEAMPSLGRFAKPQCVTIGRCSEAKPCRKNKNL